MPKIRLRRGMSACLLIALAGAANPARAEITVAMTYLRQEEKAPPVLSNLDPVPEDLGIAGAKVALTDTETTGRFLGHRYTLRVVSVEPGAISPGPRKRRSPVHAFSCSMLPPKAS